MKTKICYNVEKLVDILKLQGYEFTQLTVFDEDEEWPSHETKRCYFAKPEVISVHYYYGFGTTASIHFKDGSKVTAYSDNINAHDITRVRIDNNDYISPRFILNDIWFEATDTMTQWLISHNISMDILDDCSEEFTIYETITYEGVPTPSLEHGYKSYCITTPLVLDEREIETVLNSIEDKLLREKINCILYARIFKRKC